MNRDFIYSGSPAHIVFGEGKSAAAGEWVEKLGCSRALVLSTPHQKADAEALAERLGALAAGVFAGAVMHTPVEVTETAMRVVAETRGRLRRFARRRLDDRARQGDRLSHRPAADRHPDDLCRLGGDADPRPDRGRARRRPCRDRQILPEVVIYDVDADDWACRSALTRDLGAERHGPCGRGALRAGPQPDLVADGGRRAARLSRRSLPDDRQDAAATRERAPRRSTAPGCCGTVLGYRRHGAASQDLPHARRHFRHAACRDARGHAAAHGRLQRRGRARAAGAGRRDIRRWLGRRRALGLRQADRRAAAR